MTRILVLLICLVCIYLFGPHFLASVNLPTKFETSQIQDYLAAVNDFWKQQANLKLNIPYADLPEPNLLFVFMLAGIVILWLLSSTTAAKGEETEVVESQLPHPVPTPPTTGQEPDTPAETTGWFPPSNICRDFKWWSRYNVQKAADLVCQYYGVPFAQVIVHPSDDQANVLGRYVHDGYSSTIYLFDGGVNATVLLHELLHHLNAHGKAPVPRVAEEAAADDFAEEILTRAGRAKLGNHLETLNEKV